MKKLFYLLLIVLVVIFLFSCEKDELIIPTKTTTYVNGHIISTHIITDINSMKPMCNTDILHSIPTFNNSKFKSAKPSTDNYNYIILETTDGTIDTLSLSNGMPVLVNNVKEIYPINDNFLLFEKNSGGVKVRYELTTYNYETVYDSIPSDSTTTYTIIDTTYVNDEMWLVYYDTIVVTGIEYEEVKYDNILYNLTDGTFHDLVDDIIIYNEAITYSFNDPFYKNHDKSKFYYLNENYDVIEIDLSSGTPNPSIIYDSGTYGDNFKHIYILDDNVIYETTDNDKFMYITKNGTSNELHHNFYDEEGGSQLHTKLTFSFVLNNKLYFVLTKDDLGEVTGLDYYEIKYNSDSLYMVFDDSTDVTNYNGTVLNKTDTYNFSDDVNDYYFNRTDNDLISVSKQNFTYNISEISGFNNVCSSDDMTKMAQHSNGFIIYSNKTIYVVNPDSKSTISATSLSTDYKVTDMTTDVDENVIFYGIEISTGKNVKGIIDSSNLIDEKHVEYVEYDSNGVLITNL